MQRKTYESPCNKFPVISFFFFILNSKGIDSIRNYKGYTLLFSTFYGSGNWRSERLSKLPQGTQPGNSPAQVYTSAGQIQSPSFQRWHCPAFYVEHVGKMLVSWSPPTMLGSYHYICFGVNLTQWKQSNILNSATHTCCVLELYRIHPSGKPHVRRHSPQCRRCWTSDYGMGVNKEACGHTAVHPKPR